MRNKILIVCVLQLALFVNWSQAETFSDKAKVSWQKSLQTGNEAQPYTQHFAIGFSLAFVILLLIGILYLHNRKKLRLQKLYSQQLLLSLEQEKARISRMLHDSIGQNVLFLRNQMILNNTQELIPLLDGTLAGIRNISRDLYPNQLEKYGLIAAIDALIERVQEQADIFISHDLEALNAAMSEDQYISCYRIIEECVSNAVAHAEAAALRISAQKKHNGIELLVQDNGKGFDKSALAKKAGSAMGIFHIEERTRYLKGRLKLETSPGNGTKYTFFIPA